jgi:fumarate reductase subunit C
MKLALGVQEILALALFSALFFTLVFLCLKLIKKEGARNFIKYLYYIVIVLVSILIGILIFNLIRKTYFPVKPKVEFIPAK